MDTRRLEAFVKVVDLGSMSRAAKMLNIAQPALSQQIASLEVDFKRKLLDRSARGVMPTEAGRILYRYAKSIQRQIEEARRTILENRSGLTGNVTIGLAPLSSAALLATPLLTQVRERYPGIVLHIYDSSGVMLSEMMLKGSMDIAVLYGDRPVTGLDYKPLMREYFYLVAPRSLYANQEPSKEVSAEEVAQFDLLLPYRESFLRQTVERVCAEAGLRPRIVAEIHSQSTLSSAIAAGMGAAVLPMSIAKELPNLDKLCIRRINAPSASQQMSLCISDNVALSDAAFAVYKILLEIIAKDWGPFDFAADPNSATAISTASSNGSDEEL
ncbi:nitrogen assimilation transcriptional regulator NAC [Bradyrhizobium sp. CB82]|uniref:nitrogen assimilation transcriptional regulator NAC n=1 Tax=Bradyrhizobium sp. CB82 TaxID=3039159 RepID=UPI0024B10037|nr:nitrogen assimilation transcriptional regulator NAC [Bradyrhizobium sp. CB82]WFU42196.1 nitrogen assimilation transcriptional regulator NAC [Bradyrhizobium sp. CB82]